nr:uncharacterized protein LOC127346617 [Lolium perenne]
MAARSNPPGRAQRGPQIPHYHVAAGRLERRRHPTTAVAPTPPPGSTTGAPCAARPPSPSGPRTGPSRPCHGRPPAQLRRQWPRRRSLHTTSTHGFHPAAPNRWPPKFTAARQGHHTPAAATGKVDPAAAAPPEQGPAAARGEREGGKRRPGESAARPP